MKSNKWWTLAIGIGLALSPIHNKWLTDAATNSKGETIFFLPAFAYVILIMGTCLFLLNNWNQVRAIGFGNKRIILGLLFIVLAIALSGTAFSSFKEWIAPLGMGAVLFCLYLVGRVLGKDIFLPLGIGAIIGAIGIIIHQIVAFGQHTGGYIFEYNYDIATGYIVLGTILVLPFIKKHFLLWITLLLVPLIALLLSGSAEAIFTLGILGITVLIRRDWSKKLLIIAIPLIAIVLSIIFTPALQRTHQLTAWAITGDSQYIPSDRNPNRGTVLERRWESISKEMSDIQPFGKGYNITNFSAVAMVHNVPLVLVQQMGIPGILAAIIWLVISIWCLIKTKWKYTWTAILALSVFDHYIWTQLAPVWWLVIGASTASNIKTDMIFKETE